MSPRLTAFRDQIVFARRYSLQRIVSVPHTDWFRMPPGVPTHVAWQVGHLAMAEYRLCIERVRGVRPDDEAVIPVAFRKLFLKDSAPDADPAAYPTPEAIRATLDRVHEMVLAEFPTYDAIDLETEVMTPHTVCRTKADTLMWCSHHEMIHAGQIGLLRRLFGHKPLW